MTTTAGNYLAQASLLRLLGVLALVVAPHLTRLPPWLSLAVVAIGLWRAAAAVRQWPLPPQWLKILLVLVAFAAIQVSYGRVNGQQAGSALLVIMLALKLTEMRSRRDVLVVVALCYFTMLTHFLFSQELWTILYLGACAVVVTAILIEASHPGAALTPRVTLRMGASMVGLALPLMLVMFVLFPRIPGPLWGLPTDAGAARSGIADSMSPGDISKLIQSDAIAFRVTFLGDPPPMRERYWRGPVLSYFDGRRWYAPFRGDEYFQLYNPRAKLNAYQEAEVELAGAPVTYRVTLEPHRQHWLFAMDLPDAGALPPNTALTGYHQLLSRPLVKDALTYVVTSFPRYRFEPNMTGQWQRSATRLPDGNPRARALGESWRTEGLEGRALVDRALQLFRQQEFFYTLEPPTLGADMIDEFLFETRRGFCEHYAGAFAVLMRAAGLPARVVVGYQGGELNEVGGYFVVRQSDAHAWSEVWLPGDGWVRIDPTAAVAPSRIETGLEASLPSAELPSFLRRTGLSAFDSLRLRADVTWDYVNVMWDRWVLGFTPDRQFELLSRFGLDDWQDMIIALTVGITVLMALVGLAVQLRARPAAPADHALLLWRRATRVLAARGLAQAPYEGPRDYVERVLRDRPDLEQPLRRLLGAYLAARYLDERPREAEVELSEALRALKAWRGSPTSPGTAA
jgi:transglutaminase-like putative cysteine protease